MGSSQLILIVAVICSFHFAKPVDCLRKTEVSVYLDGGTTNLRGKVSLSINGDSPQLLEASHIDWRTSSVICRHLGAGPPILTLLTRYNTDGYNYFYSVSHIQCTGWETVLSDCKLELSRLYLHVSPQVMEVKCAPSLAKDFEVVFVQQFEDLHQGIVLTYVDGRWGPVTGLAVNNNEVICKEMGYSPGEDLRGSGEVQVFAHPVIKNLICRGTESRMQECSYNKPDNHPSFSSLRDPVYVTACTDDIYDREKHTPYTYGVNEYPSYTQGIHSSSFVSVLTVIVLMAVSLVICLRCGLGGNHSDNESATVDLGSPSDVRHIYQRYHTGSGPGYQQVPCTVHHALPVERNPVRSSSQARKASGRGTRDPPSYDTSVCIAGLNSDHRTGSGRGYAPTNLEFHRGCYSGRGAPTNSAWDQSVDREYGVESTGGYHPGSGSEYFVQSPRGTTPPEPSASSYQPGSGRCTRQYHNLFLKEPW
ncbi:putative deleted in malignant brain tumors 1 protein [Apostichopus japonicus]|uniref:Putative deleted in malignant brain tumors 1 protein n=1 Tax=Stichopus japonicus TaxID=307972 RepID=A0A2G8K6W6_STIJA|nr:putative deleted in malignant brain tumors 1 protein [Apostichopus japonicus]